MLSYLMRQHPNLSGRPTRRRDGASTRLALYFTGPSAPALDLKVLVSSHLSNPAPHFVFSSLHVCFAIAPYPPLLSQHHLVHHFVACVVYSPMSPRVVCAGLILSRKPHSLEQNPGNLHSSKKKKKKKNSMRITVNSWRVPWGLVSLWRFLSSSINSLPFGNSSCAIENCIVADRVDS